MHKQSFSDKMRIFLAKYSEISERLNSSTIDEQLKKHEVATLVLDFL